MSKYSDEACNCIQPTLVHTGFYTMKVLGLLNKIPPIICHNFAHSTVMCVAALKPGYFAYDGLKSKTIPDDTGHNYFMDQDAKLCPQKHW